LCGNKPFKDLKAYLHLRREFLDNQLDVVHTHTSKAGFLGRLAASKAGIAMIITPRMAQSILQEADQRRSCVDTRQVPFLLAERSPEEAGLPYRLKQE